MLQARSLAVSKNWPALLERHWAVSPQPEEGPEPPLLLYEKVDFGSELASVLEESKPVSCPPQ